MKKLIFIHSLSSGGAERVAVYLAEHWHSLGEQVIVVTVADSEKDFYRLSSGIQRISLNRAKASQNPIKGIINNYYRIISLRKILHQQQPDVAISFMSRSNIVLAIAALGLKNVITIGSERIYPPKLPLGKVWEILRCRMYGHLTALVAQTQKGCEWLEQHTHANKVCVIPNFVVWPLPEFGNQIAPSSIGNNNAKRILAVGRLAEQKGFSLLITVFCRLAELFPDWDLVILGEGPLRQQLTEQINCSNYAQRIFLPGSVGNVGHWYNHADIYVMSSLFEGFPNTLIEAMSYNLPVISFDCDTGPRDIIHHNENGLLIKEGSTEDLFEGLQLLMSSKTKRIHFAQQAVKVRQYYSLDNIMNKWQQLINELIKTRKN